MSDRCPQPCDPDCEVGSEHCVNVHLPDHKWTHPPTSCPSLYRLEGGPYAGPNHWAMAYALAKGKTPWLCVKRSAGWHRYVRGEDANVYVWAGPCTEDHELEECVR